MDNEFETLKKRIKQLEANNERLRENLRGQITACSSVSHYSSPKDKIALFRSLFFGRQDVYALRWERSGGNSGYQPVCLNLWKEGICEKPRGTCSKCSSKLYAHLTDEVIYNHLSGKITIGIYPLLENEDCKFLAADFDDKEWVNDAMAVRRVCQFFSIPVHIERSRSGRGCHLWFFFKEAIKASIARKLGFALLNRVLENRPGLGLSSYDRFFPNQDTLPKGGLGNLIALPLQGRARKEGNTVFLNENLIPYEDQWAFLSSVEPIDYPKIEDVLRQSSSDRSGKHKLEIQPRKEALPKEINLRIDSMIRIEKDALPSSIMNEILKLASFDNPEFFRAQAMRLSTHNKPRRISCAEEDDNDFILPRGCLDDSLNLLSGNGIRVNLVQNRSIGNSIEFTFNGKLTPEQDKAVLEMLAYDTGILCAPTGSGKTVIALKLIAYRKRSTLILVHRKELLRQWQESACEFLQISPDEIGQIGLGKNTAKGTLDIALIQSLARNDDSQKNLPNYGQVIVDECQHIPAFTLERVVKNIPVYYVIGLTATPKRRDGHQPIMHMQCGPMRHRMSRKSTIFFGRTFIPRFTKLIVEDTAKPQQIYRAIEIDERRNKLICNDIRKALEAGKSCLVLSERVLHIELLYKMLADLTNIVFLLHGKQPKKAQNESLNGFKKVNNGVALLSTGRYLGEGFDDPRLDTLFLTFPISWKGVLQQYAGRLHRENYGKHEVRIYDYVDENIHLLKKMYNNRQKGYKALGYIEANIE